MVYEVHHNDLTQAQAAEAAVLDFNATWCNPCRMLAPVLEQVSEELAGKALFCGIDVDQNPALAALRLGPRAAHRPHQGDPVVLHLLHVEVVALAGDHRALLLPGDPVQLGGEEAV